MIILKVIGGLGNQLFEVAFAKALSIEQHEEVYLDCSSYRRYKIRDFSLSNFNIIDTIKMLEEIDLSSIFYAYMKITQKTYHVLQRLSKEVKSYHRLGDGLYHFLSRYGLYYNLDPYYYFTRPSKSRIKIVYGYFQSALFFDKHEEIIKKLLKVKTVPTDSEIELLNEIGSSNAVGVSIRLGKDYLNSPALNVFSEDYYYNGIEYIKKKIRTAKFFIFSDCIDEVKKRFQFKYPVRYVEGFKDYQGLRLLYSCKHFLISNSTFSWWGAYLSEYEKKIVVAPKKWRKNTSDQPDIRISKMNMFEM